eukprot:1171273-Rhodomonas_salina.1
MQLEDRGHNIEAPRRPNALRSSEELVAVLHERQHRRQTRDKLGVDARKHLHFHRVVRPRLDPVDSRDRQGHRADCLVDIDGQAPCRGRDMDVASDLEPME